MEQFEGLFIGLSTIDIEYLVEKLPQTNTKAFSTEFAILAGGPVYNAAVTFSFLGGKAVFLSAVGHGKLSSVVRDDADAHQVWIIDGDSWTPGIEEPLPRVDVAICSECFLPPGASNVSEVFESLKQVGVKQVAITRGERPVLFFDGKTSGQIDLPKIRAVDTLAAGDIFHGAFSYFYACGIGFVEALENASEVATIFCKYFGLRSWMRSAEGSMVRLQTIEDERHGGESPTPFGRR